MVYIIVFTITCGSYHQGLRCRGRRDAFSLVTTLICFITGGSVRGSRGIFIWPLWKIVWSSTMALKIFWAIILQPLVFMCSLSFFKMSTFRPLFGLTNVIPDLCRLSTLFIVSIDLFRWGSSSLWTNPATTTWAAGHFSCTVATNPSILFNTFRGFSPFPTLFVPAIKQTISGWSFPMIQFIWSDSLSTVAPGLTNA